MKGTVLIPDLLNESRRESRFLLAWMQNAYDAFVGLYRYEFTEFNYGGHGAEYWTPINHLLQNKIIPESELAQIAILYLESNPLSLSSYRAHSEILQEMLPEVCEWVQDNFDKLYSDCKVIARDVDVRNSFEHIGILLIECLACAPSHKKYQNFLKRIWMTNPNPFSQVFRAVFSENGKYGPEADQAIYFFIKRCRRSLRKNPDSEYEVVGKIRCILYKRYGLFENGSKPISSLSIEESRVAIKILEKIKRIIIAQNAHFPL